MESVDFGELSFGIPDDCPNRDVFRDVIKDELNYFFAADLARAAYCASEYVRCQDVPLPFFENWEAAVHYRAAQMALSPAAQKWGNFRHSVYDRFSDIADDGDRQTPAIPGWHLDELFVTVAPRAQRQAAPQSQRQAVQQPRTWRLDQMKVVEPQKDKGRGRGR
ncbi:hypothetical protein [Methylobacterium sp. WSM2598]|uniref:hypothetical protein n=1 Tax=Methylobacterium sp. WSM2598 TaxID=398261 RepID=UPI0012F6363D|nr:hypothetical protein [Methylobacterium sp. WSM2598]